jgi:DNA-binding MarR family transcriptional regulator
MPSEQKDMMDSAFDLVASCRAFHAAIDNLDAAAADRLGISRNDLRGLNAIERGAESPKDLVAALNLTSGSITAMLDRLERKDLIRRRPHPVDRRGLIIEIQPHVFKQLAPIYRTFGEAVANLSDKRASEDVAVIIDAMRDLTHLANTIAGRPPE